MHVPRARVYSSARDVTKHKPIIGKAAAAIMEPFRKTALIPLGDLHVKSNLPNGIKIKADFAYS